MSSEKPPKPPVDELAKELRTSLAQRRPRAWKPVLGLIVLCGAILFLLIWWLYPRPRTPPFMIVALDGLFTEEEKPLARAQLLPPQADMPAPRWHGHAIVFDDPLGGKPEGVVVQSDEHGQATLAWPLVGAPAAPFSAQYIDREQRHSSGKEFAVVHVWPKAARVLLVDADETLIGDKVDERAAPALQQAAAEGWNIAYLAPAAAEGVEFRTARGWIADQVKLPKGPILGRLRYPSDESHAAARAALLESLKGRFTGPLAVVVKSADAAEACKTAGIRAFRIGDAATPTWAEVSLK